MRLLAGVVLAVVLTACSGGSSTSATTAEAPDTSGSLPATPTVPSGHPRTACAAFGYFYADLTTYTPHAVALLVADAGRVQKLAVKASGRRLLDDATALVGAVSSSSWVASGNVDAPAVTRMQADCP